MKTAYHIDYSNMLYRFRHTFQFARTVVEGVEVDTSTLYGFIKTLKGNFYKDIFICLDGVPQRFFDILPSYKGQRQFDPSEEVRIPFSETVKFLTAIGPLIDKNIRVVASPGQEADQVISSLVHLHAGIAPPNPVFYTKAYNNMQITLDTDPHLKKLSKGCKLSINEYDFDTSIVASTDSDMYQLLQHDNVYIDESTNGRKLLPRNKTPKAVKELPPACIPAYKMIVGDISDNVPNIGIDIKDEVLINTIRNYINTHEAIEEFINQIRLHNNLSNLSLIKEVRDIQEKIVRSNKLGALLVNREITKLVYNSTPFELSYEDYNIEDTIKKYRLKV